MRDKKSVTFFAAVAILVVVSASGAYYFSNQTLEVDLVQQETQTENTSQTAEESEQQSASLDRSIVGDGSVMDEIARLASLSSQGRLTVGELETLRSMTIFDSYARHEFTEIRLMVEYGEQLHAGHALGFLSGYVSTGKYTLCPGHLLAHYYVFARHNNTHLADESFEVAKGQFEPWLPEARSFNERYPSGYEFDFIRNKIKDHFNQIEGGATNASDDEIDFLTEKTICVQSEFRYGHG